MAKAKEARSLNDRAAGKALVSALRQRSTMIAVAVVGCFITNEFARAQPVDELIRHVPGDGDVVVRRVDDIPPLVRNALKESPPGCRPAEHALSELGMITFQPAPGFFPMALVACESIMARSAVLLFDRGLTNPPSVMKLPPRLFIWNAKTKEFTGYAISDMASTPWYVGRNIYRHLGSGEINGFTLVARERGEYTNNAFNNWQPIVQAEPSDAPR